MTTETGRDTGGKREQGRATSFWFTKLARMMEGCCGAPMMKQIMGAGPEGGDPGSKNHHSFFPRLMGKMMEHCCGDSMKERMQDDEAFRANEDAPEADRG